jgi:DNA-binding NarL/FixJ family response regulator
MTAAQIRVVLVDDHVLMREGLREILEIQPDIKVVGEAGDSAGAVDVVTEQQPDVLLLDVEIPGDEVTTTVSRLRELAPRTEIVILSMYDGPHLLQRLLALGIRGYLLKSVSRQELVAAVRNACADDGRIILSVSRRSLAQMPANSGGALSRRELDVLELAAQAIVPDRSDGQAPPEQHLRQTWRGFAHRRGQQGDSRVADIRGPPGGVRCGARST